MNAQATTMKSLRDKAVLVQLSRSCWTGRKVDRPLSAEINAVYKVKNNKQGYYKKWLIPKEAFEEINQVHGEAARYHESVTLPWLNDGVRMAPSNMLQEYMTTMRAFKTKAEAAYRKFYARYPQLIKEGMMLLGNAAKLSDYPSEQLLRSKFGFEVVLLPIPDVDDWRMDVSKKEMDELRQQATATLDAVQKAALQELWQRLFDEVEHLEERLKKSDNTFRGTLITNIKDTAKLLGKLNIAGDANLERMRKEVEAELTKYNADELRDDDALRGKVAKSATDIMKKMTAYMGAPK